MKRLYALIVLCFVMFVLQACQEPTKEDVIEDLDQKQQELRSYHAEVMMEISTGENAQVYDIDLSYMVDDFYRVVMKNDQSEEDQVILKNEEGVFVLTPALDKQFRFQSDWPDNFSQPYLYASLIEDVLTDEQAVFENEEDRFRFSVQTNYKQNDQLASQDIYFDKKTLAPLSVHVYDKTDQEVVNVTFNSFSEGIEFEADYFERELDESLDMHDSDQAEESLGEIDVHYPMNTLGAELIEETWFDDEDRHRVMLRYSGANDFTLVQELKEPDANTSHVMASSGDVVFLENQEGVLTDQSLTFSNSGVDYYLSSETLNPIEMVQVVESMQPSMQK
ncbi:Outer membrane lipoprotein-sorting protein [Pelagirhabdus alkalitolerans]|uniref:Outer membrane lipoprotein-sorting protein n=2 Tax=Pelagirhabdus alkalitolerans TaxID=1612202 RepID=A0A1G6JEX0_9BACI|nr:Outer membrane lipoprotein-sorting protein [Pelagirhabdus alkalitolerans]